MSKKPTFVDQDELLRRATPKPKRPSPDPEAYGKSKKGRNHVYWSKNKTMVVPKEVKDYLLKVAKESGIPSKQLASLLIQDALKHPMVGKLVKLRSALSGMENKEGKEE
ncbi:MAG: hypothetical protein ACXABY_16340 [Candidatus Thorarchaeota archaeon]|jgi:hypothetical protein